MEKTQHKCRLLTVYYRPKPGGFCKRLFRAMDAFLAAGHEVHYLAVVPFPVEHPDCHFHRFPWPRTRTDGFLFWGFFHLLSPLILIYLGIRHRITHIFSFGHNYAFLLQPLRWLTRVPLSVFLRADTLENHRIKGRAPLLIAIDHFVEGIGIWGVRLYGVSRTLANTVVHRHRWLKPSVCSVLRNDVEVMPERVWETPTIPLRLACVGVLEARKNQALVLRCMKQLSSGLVRLDVYGDGPDRVSLEQLVDELQITDSVLFRGWTDPAEIWPNVDLLLVPSLHEGAPNVVLEALAWGIPVLASDIPEHREILPPPVLIPLHTDVSWINVLDTVVTNPAAELVRLRTLEQPAGQSLQFDWEDRIRTIVFGLDATLEE